MNSEGKKEKDIIKVRRIEIIKARRKKEKREEKKRGDFFFPHAIVTLRHRSQCPHWISLSLVIPKNYKM